MLSAEVVAPGDEYLIMDWLTWGYALMVGLCEGARLPLSDTDYAELGGPHAVVIARLGEGFVIGDQHGARCVGRDTLCTMLEGMDHRFVVVGVRRSDHMETRELARLVFSTKSLEYFNSVTGDEGAKQASYDVVPGSVGTTTNVRSARFMSDVESFVDANEMLFAANRFVRVKASHESRDVDLVEPTRVVEHELARGDARDRAPIGGWSALEENDSVADLDHWIGW